MWGIQLQYDDEITLSRQIFLAFKERILAGELPQGEAMPSTRELAKILGVSRNTVSEAYSMLWAEGFIVSHQGAPSRVAEGLLIPQRKGAIGSAGKGEAQPIPPIQWDFKTGQPDLALFPWHLWSQMLRIAANEISAEDLSYQDPKGYGPLCEEIAHWLLRSRGMEVDPGDIFITSGATQGLHLLVGMLYRQGCPFVLENPSHPAIRRVIEDRGYPLEWMAVDGEGAVITSLQAKGISAVYVTPSHQFPLGGILPAGRRIALIRQAVKEDFYILEDDYDSEFRYAGAPISPLYAFNASRVIYVGTFSKTLFPALRLGFVILPKPLQKEWRHYRHYMDVQNPILEQVALAAFLKNRKMDKHVQRMRRIYGEKRKVLLKTIEDTFGEAAVPWGDISGLHLALQFPGRELGEVFVHKCRDAGIRITSVAQYCSGENPHGDKLLLGYGHLTHGQIVEGIQALGRLIE